MEIAKLGKDTKTQDETDVNSKKSSLNLCSMLSGLGIKGNLKKEEKIANQRNLLTVQIFARMKVKAIKSPPHSIKNVVFDWLSH